MHHAPDRDVATGPATIPARPTFVYPPPPPPPPPPHVVSLAARPELDQPVRGRSRRRLALPGGVLLFLAMFLPATRVCGERAVTGLELLRFPPLALPYVIGVVVALAVLAPRVRGLRSAGIALQVLGVLAMIGFGLLAHAGLAANNPAPAGVATMAWWAAAIALRPALSSRTTWERRVARTLAVIGLGCALWFAIFLAIDPDVLYGTAVACVGALLVGLGGIGWETELRVARPAAWIPVARAR